MNYYLKKIFSGNTNNNIQPKKPLIKNFYNKQNNHNKENKRLNPQTKIPTQKQQ